VILIFSSTVSSTVSSTIWRDKYLYVYLSISYHANAIPPVSTNPPSKAAEALNKDRSAFILDVACREAENVLLDQRFFQLDDEAFTDFNTALDAPVPDNSKLKSLLVKPSPWE
jgi:uncharacterized protein (DUF1778 family)